MKKILVLSILILSIVLLTSVVAHADKPTGFDNNGNATGHVNDNGFDEFGYNRTARIFSGTGWSWCMGKFDNETFCTGYIGPYANDKLVMKWNAEWDRGNAESWSNPPYDAWENNQWNGMIPDGSGETWHYKIVWNDICGAYGTPTTSGGYCIWNQFEVLMSHGTFEGAHFWDAHALPNGYGFYPFP